MSGPAERSECSDCREEEKKWSAMSRIFCCVDQLVLKYKA
jgi:hypothetical protein